jgi:hypothetical protein
MMDCGSAVAAPPSEYVFKKVQHESGSVPLIRRPGAVESSPAAEQEPDCTTPQSLARSEYVFNEIELPSTNDVQLPVLDSVHPTDCPAVGLSKTLECAKPEMIGTRDDTLSELDKKFSEYAFCDFPGITPKHNYNPPQPQPATAPPSHGPGSGDSRSLCQRRALCGSGTRYTAPCPAMPDREIGAVCCDCHNCYSQHVEQIAGTRCMPQAPCACWFTRMAASAGFKERNQECGPRKGLVAPPVYFPAHMPVMWGNRPHESCCQPNVEPAFVAACGRSCSCKFFRN